MNTVLFLIFLFLNSKLKLPQQPKPRGAVIGTKLYDTFKKQVIRDEGVGQFPLHSLRQVYAAFSSRSLGHRSTNIIISRLLLPSSISARAIDLAQSTGEFLASDDTLEELAAVIARPKFEKYIAHAERLEFFSYLSRITIRHKELTNVQVCRDPKDDKLLSLSLSGQADALLTGDKDLLPLHPFMNIPILNPEEFIKKFG